MFVCMELKKVMWKLTKGATNVNVRIGKAIVSFGKTTRDALNIQLAFVA